MPVILVLELILWLNVASRWGLYSTDGVCEWRLFPVDRSPRKHRGERSRQSVARCPMAYVAQWPRLAERMQLTPASLSGPAEHMVLIIASSLNIPPIFTLSGLVNNRIHWVGRRGTLGHSHGWAVVPTAGKETRGFPFGLGWIHTAREWAINRAAPGLWMDHWNAEGGGNPDALRSAVSKWKATMW